MPDLSIITLSRNVDYFARLVGALASTTVEFQGILVNNANSMALTATALQAGWMVIEPGHNTTFSEGNNLGVKAANGHWVLLLNDDAIPTPSFLNRMWAWRQSAGVLGALLLHGNDTVNHAGTRVGLNGATDHLGRYSPRKDWECAAAVPVPAVTFAAAMVNVSLYRELGGLDERYRYGWEDTDFCMRVLKAGAIIRCVRDAVAVHDECGTRPRGGAMDAENMSLFLQTWQKQLPTLLKEYVKRVGKKREGVEGVG